MRKTTARLAAAGALTVAALGATSGAALAGTAYVPSTPTPTVSDSVTPSASPTTGGSTPGVSVSRTTTPAAVGGSNDELAYTGADVLPWAAAGTVLVLGGAAMVVAGRRKPGRSH
ncbi:hypothetical protein AB2L28_01810 [Kineococcus sp. TBRC 1896]|uniref:LPXTG-motif cell wall-anchored protein n=1 Tax=Kineococcus mangrovi TaxID=1660183 RepID=A0ABV4HX30_9ACTN